MSNRWTHRLLGAAVAALAIAGVAAAATTSTWSAAPPSAAGGERIAFTAAALPGTGSIGFEVDPQAPGSRTLVLRVVATEVTDLYGVSFDVRYPSRLVKFLEEEIEEGAFLSEDGTAETVFLFKRRAPKTIIVGLSRVGEVAGVDGSGTLLTLRFRARDQRSGRGALIFLENDAVGSDGELLTDTVWIDGSLVVQAP